MEDLDKNCRTEDRQGPITGFPVQRTVCLGGRAAALSGRAVVGEMTMENEKERGV